jgi:hypothetical protein
VPLRRPGAFQPVCLHIALVHDGTCAPSAPDCHQLSFEVCLQVLAMLDQAKHLIDEGRMTPEELDRNLTMNLQVHSVLHLFGYSCPQSLCFPCKMQVLSHLAYDFLHRAAQ